MAQLRPRGIAALRAWGGIAAVTFAVSWAVACRSFAQFSAPVSGHSVQPGFADQAAGVRGSLRSLLSKCHRVPCTPPNAPASGHVVQPGFTDQAAGVYVH